MTVDDVVSLLKETEHNGYPVVVSRESQYLVGFVLRRDLYLAIGSKRRNEKIFNLSKNTNISIQIMQNECWTESVECRWYCLRLRHQFKI